MSDLTSKKMDDPLESGTGNCIVNSSVVVTVPVVTVNIFFDGTGNNKENTALRLKIDDYLQELNRLNSDIEEKESLEKELYMRSRSLPKGSSPQLDEEILGLRKEILKLFTERQALKEEKEISEALEKETSYNNDFTNVALLEMVAKKTPVPPIYIEGAGTTKYEKDDSAGLGMAKGSSGVVKRVEEAFIKLNKLVETNGIKLLKLNVFGFSRGAFYARVFCAWAKQKLSEDVKRRYEKRHIGPMTPLDECKIIARMHLGLASEDININLLGIYDTVSSYQLNHVDDPEEIDLKVGDEQEIASVVHLTAQNEYRYHFPLTPIHQALSDGCGLEISFPGAHSNLGGSYTDHFDEKYHYLSLKTQESIHTDLKTGQSYYRAPGLRRKGEVPWTWWEEMGYYTKDQLRLLYGKSYGDLMASNHGEVYGHRVVRHHYQYIYLNAMQYFAEQLAVIDFSNYSEDYDQRQAAFEKQKNEDPIFKKFSQYVEELIESKYCYKGRYKVDLAAVLPDKGDRQHLYNNYIFNSLMPVNFKLRGRAKGGLDRNEEAAYFAGVANEGHDNNQGLNGNPIRIEVSGG